MKKNIFLVTFFILMTVKAQNYNTQTHTDPKGYIYETVTNDPTQSRVYTLKNGLKVYLSKNTDEPRIQTYIPVRTGSANDPSDNTGLAHYLEHMVFKGTSKIGTINWEAESALLNQISGLYEKHKQEKDPVKKKEIYLEIDKVSQEASKYAIANEYDKMISNLGTMGTNAHTWLDETVYKNNIPSNELERWLFVEKERFSELVLRLFHTELETVYEEFNRAQDNDSYLVNKELMDALFPTHKYGQQTTIGESEHLKNPSMEAIHTYFNTYYIPNNMAVVLVGDLDYDNAIQLVDKYFGSFQYKELPRVKKVTEQPLASVVKRTVTTPSAERLQIAFRTEGIRSEEAKYIQLIDMILSNSGAGLIDTNINQKQKAQGAASYSLLFNDYGIHYLFGGLREGQTFNELEKLLIEQLEEIKKGNFEDWLLSAIINDLKTKRIQSWDKSNGVATQMYNAFITNQSWGEVLKYINDLSKITKDDIVKFANNFYKDNYVIVYKEKGENSKLIRVENPKITPIPLNRTDQSEFYNEFLKLPETEIQPEFIDYNTLIKTESLNNTPFYFVKNNNNPLAELHFIYDFGSDNNKELALALGYLNLIGTNKYTKPELEKEFYKIGITSNIETSYNTIRISLLGLEENMPKGIELLEHLFSTMKPDDEAYQNYVQTILRGRKNSKTNKQIIFSALSTYARFGENNRVRNNISEKELLNKNPEELINTIKELNNYKKEIFYYGSNVNLIRNSLVSYLNSKENQPYPYTIKYEELASNNTLYFIPYDMVQTEIYFQSRGDKFDSNKIPLARIFGEYFGSGLSSIVFQEIRESKSLAYSAYAGYAPAPEKDKYDYVNSYIGTQANKLPEAVEAMNTLMTHMPESEKQFNSSKNGALKQIASSRITKTNIFWSYRSNKKRGLENDMRKEVYNTIQTLTLTDLKNFFNQEIKGKSYTISLIGKKENLDWNAVQKLGTVKELSIDELFNY